MIEPPTAADAIAQAVGSLTRLDNVISEAILDDVADAVAHQLHQLTGRTTPAAASEVPAGPPADLRYPDVAEWVSHYLLRNWRRNQWANIWCTTWWEHGEAITRLKGDVAVLGRCPHRRACRAGDVVAGHRGLPHGRLD